MLSFLEKVDYCCICVGWAFVANSKKPQQISSTQQICLAAVDLNPDQGKPPASFAVPLDGGGLPWMHTNHETLGTTFLRNICSLFVMQRQSLRKLICKP